MPIFIAVLGVIYCAFADERDVAVAYLAAVGIHEAGHLIMAKICGVSLTSKSLSPLGIRFKFDFGMTSPLKQVIICLAGSALGILAAVTAMLCLPQNKLVASFTVASLSLATVNLLPIRGLDGGQVCEALLEWICLPSVADKIFRAISALFAIGLWVITVWSQFRAGENLSLLTLSVYFLLTSLLPA